MDERKIDLIVTSSLDRAVETGKIIAEKEKCQNIISEKLIEQNFGIFEGVDRSDENYQKEKRRFFVRYQDGESIIDVAGRVVPFICELRDMKYNTVLIVTHGGICRVICSLFEDFDNDEFTTLTMANCEVKEFTI